MKQSQTAHIIRTSCLEKGMKVQVLGESILIHPNSGETELHQITARVGATATFQDEGEYFIQISPSFHPLAHIIRFMDDPDAGFFNLTVGENSVSFLFDDGNSQVDYDLPIETVVSAAQDCGMLSDYDHSEVWVPGWDMDDRPYLIKDWLNDWVRENKASSDLHSVMHKAMQQEWTDHITRIGSELHRLYYNSNMERAIENPEFQRNVLEMASIIGTLNQ